MKYFSDETWARLPISDFRPRFFVETYIEKLSIHTPHFYQSRLMSVFSSCSETLTYITEYRLNDKNGGYILSALDEIEACWSADPIAQTLFAYMDEPRRQLLRHIKGGDFSPNQLNRLSVFCRAIQSREDDYVSALVADLRKTITEPCDLSQRDRIATKIYELTGLLTTYLLNKGFSPTYLFTRADMFTRENNYYSRSFQEQFDVILERLRNLKVSFDVYYGLRANRPSTFLGISDDPDFTFSELLPNDIPEKHLDKIKRDEPNVIAKSVIESTDYVSAAWRIKEKLDKVIDSVTALDLNPRIKISSSCVVVSRPQNVFHTNTVSIDVLIGFLASEGGTHFSNTEASIRHAFSKLNEEGREHLGRSLRYLRLARESISIEQKLLNLWIALESLFSDGANAILTNILEYVPQIYGVSGLRRRIIYLKQLLVKNSIPIPELLRSQVLSDAENFDADTTDGQVFWLLRNEVAAVQLFSSLGNKDHLKFRLQSIFNELKTNSAIEKRIERSEIDVARQLRRIYFLRNKMTHTGHYANIRPQLVTHLLDYVAVCYAALSTSAKQSKLENSHSIGDLLAAYKMGMDVVMYRCSTGNIVESIDDLIPAPII